MSTEVIIADMLRIAQQDLKAALRLSFPSNRLAVYLCEKAAENLIRAVLASEGQRASFGQNLEAMVDLIPALNPLKSKLRGVEGLSSFGATYRYTTPAGQIPPPPDASVFLSYVKKVEEALQEAAARFGVDLTPNATSPAQFPEPIR